MTLLSEGARPTLVREFAEADGYAPLVALLADEPSETRLDLALAIWSRLVGGESGGEASADRLFVAERSGRLVGVAGATVAAGRLAGVRPPVWMEADGTSVRDALFRSIEQFLQSAGVATTFVSRPSLGFAIDDDVIQSPDAGDRERFLFEGAAWRRASDRELAGVGFRDRVELDVLIRDLHGGVQAEAPGDARRSWRDAELLPTAQLQELVEATYEGSLDCPVLNGRRSVADVLEGYRSEGEDPIWEVAIEGDDPVGCSFLSDHPETDSMELLYFGVCPAVRGRGLGRTIVQRALRRAAQRGRAAVVLSADRDNRPAGEIYRKLGFVQADRRNVFLKFFPETVEAPASSAGDTR